VGVEALLKGWVSRNRPQAQIDNQPDIMRFSRYKDAYVIPVVRKQHALADEGTYFVANANAQAGILGSAATGFVATTPILTVYNSDSPSNQGAVRVHVDFLNLVTTVVGSAASGLVNLQAALYIDQGPDRYTSGGTDLTNNIVNVNMDVGQRVSVAKVRFGAITATAATGSVRAISPLRIIRPAVSGTVLDVVGEVKWFNFGGVEGMLSGSMTAANANFIPVPMPPVVLGPNQQMLLYLWQNVGATNVAATYAPELGYWER